MDPFSAWSRMMSAGLEMQRNWLHAAETVSASTSVIRERTDLMCEAVRSPLTADVAEFSRMVPEKVDAFSRSGQAAMIDLSKMQMAWWSQAQAMTAMLMAGRAPTPSELSGLVARTQGYALNSIEASARMGRTALAPVHRTATGNARRLGAAKCKSRT